MALNVDRNAKTAERIRKNFQRISQGAVMFQRLPADPTLKDEGDIYYNTTSKHFFGWNGTVWKQLDN